MRFREVFRYELTYRLRSGSTWAYAGFLFLVMYWGLAATSGGGAVHANVPQRVAQGERVCGAAADILRLNLPPDAACLLSSRELSQSAYMLWDLVHDRADEDLVKRRVVECHEALARLSARGGGLEA